MLCISAGSHVGIPQYSAPQAPHPAMTMHPSPSPHMSPGMAPTHVSHPPQFTSGHPSMMPPSSGLYSPHSGPYGPMPPMPGQEIPPSNLGTYSLAVI